MSVLALDRPSGRAPVADLEPGAPAQTPEVVHAFAEVARAIAEERDLDSVLHTAASQICSLVGTNRCTVYLRDEGNGVFRGRIAHSHADIDRAIKRYVAGIEADRFTHEILAKRRPVFIRNAQSDPRPVRSAMIAWRIRSMLGVPMILRDVVIGLLFLDNEDEAHEFTEPQQQLALAFASLTAIAISQSQLTADLRATLNMAGRRNAILRRAAAIDERLAELVARDGTLAEIAGAVSELSGRACEICDASFRRLAGAQPKVEAPVPRLLTQEIAAQRQVREALVGLSAQRPAVIPADDQAGIGRRRLVAAVAVGSEILGYLTLVEDRIPLTRQDAVLIRRAAMIIALQLKGLAQSAEDRAQTLEAIATDLLTGIPIDPQLAVRAGHHGVSADGPHVVALLSLPEEDSTALDRRTITVALASVDSPLRSFATRVGTAVAVIHQWEHGAVADPVGEVKRVIAEVLDQLGPRRGVRAAVSTVCHRAADLPDALTQTQDIIRASGTFNGSAAQRIQAADDFGPARLLLSLRGRQPADRFVRETLGTLLDADAEDLLETLDAFFGCSRNIRRAAETLGLHGNSMRYRLGRISEITGLNILTDSETQLAIELSLLVLRLEGRLPGRGTSVTPDDTADDSCQNSQSASWESERPALAVGNLR